MSNFRCQFIGYLPVHFVSSISGTEIIPVSGQTVRELFLSDTPEPNEVQKELQGNPFFEQTLKVVAKYNNVSEISELIINKVIVQLTDVDGNKKVWGTIEPYNPVSASVKASKQFADITFSRDAALLEF